MSSMVCNNTLWVKIIPWCQPKNCSLLLFGIACTVIVTYLYRSKNIERNISSMLILHFTEISISWKWFVNKFAEHMPRTSLMQICFFIHQNLHSILNFVLRNESIYFIEMKPWPMVYRWYVANSSHLGGDL